MSKHSDEIRNKYIKNPPEGMTADDIRHMSEDDLLDMDYFLNEDDEFGEDFPGAEGKRLQYLCNRRNIKIPCRKRNREYSRILAERRRTSAGIGNAA